MRRLLMLLLVAPAMLWAQTKDSVQALPSIQVTAAAPAQVVTKPVESAPHQELALALSMLPSITATSDAGSGLGYTYLRIRGMDMTRLAVTFNGLPIADAEDQGFYSSNIPNLGRSTRVTLTPGAAGSVGGAAGLAGQLDINTGSPFAIRRSVEGTLGLGSYGTHQLVVALSTGPVGNNAAWLNVTGQQSAGFRTGAFEEGKSAIGGIAHVTGDAVLSLTGAFGDVRHGSAWMPEPLSVARANTAANDLNGLGEHFRQGVLQAAVDASVTARDRISVTVMGNWVQGAYDIPTSPILDMGVSQRWYQVAGTWERRYGTVVVTSGLLLSTDARDHFMNPKDRVFEVLYTNTGHKTEQTAWTRLTALWEGFTVIPELQVRHAGFAYTPSVSGGTFETKTWTFANPKVTVLRSLTSTLSARVSAAYTSREPTRSDLFSGNDDLTPAIAAEIRANPVHPETMWSVEAALQYRRGMTDVTVNVFSMNFRNEIAPNGPYSIGGLPLRQNVPVSYRRGVEVDATTGLWDGAMVMFAGSLIDASIVYWNDKSTGETAFNTRPLQTPPYLANVTLRQNIGPATVAWTHAAMGAIFLSNTEDKANWLDPMYVEGFAASYTWGRRTLKVSVNNVLNSFLTTGGWASVPEPMVYVYTRRSVDVQVNFPLR